MQSRLQWPIANFSLDTMCKMHMMQWFIIERLKAFPLFHLVIAQILRLRVIRDLLIVIRWPCLLYIHIKTHFFTHFGSPFVFSDDYWHSYSLIQIIFCFTSNPRNWKYLEHQQTLCSNQWETFEWPKPKNPPWKQSQCLHLTS